jgi:pimeloyl-ACP methyl ester carboxylesterase
MNEEQRVRPSSLLIQMGITPADNREGLKTAVPWKSMWGGAQTRALFQYQHFLDEVSRNYSLFGPLSILASLQNTFFRSSVTDPIRTHARITARAGKEPDIFRDMNGWIYKNYARSLYDLCGFFMKDGTFDRKKARQVATTPEGHRMLKEYVQEFAQMENNYNSLGMTRLKAMKEMLRCLLVVITEMPLEGEDLPFMRKNADGTDGMTFEQYLVENRFRLECLYQANAFDPKEYSERATQGRIGCSDYEIVKGSRNHCVQLRHYLLPKGVKPNGRVLYISTPLINKPELFDLADGKSVVQGMLREGYAVYLVDHGEAGPDDTNLGLDFFGKTIHDRYLEIIRKKHPRWEIDVMGYCMGGTLMLPYLARRAEERMARGETMDICKIALMASPVRFDDAESGHGQMRSFIRQNYDPNLMTELFGSVNIPPQTIDFGMNEIQPGVHYTVLSGFYGRAIYSNAIEDSAPFLYWLTHGTKFPARAHREWIEHFFLGNGLVKGTYRLPSTIPELDGAPVDMEALRKGGVRIFDYRGSRDPIAPPGSCVASQLWGMRAEGNIQMTRGGLNRTFEKNIGHIFVVSKTLLAEYLKTVSDFLNEIECEGVDETK